MSRTYTHVQELLPSVLAMKEEGYTYRQIANQYEVGTLRLADFHQ